MKVRSPPRLIKIAPLIQVVASEPNNSHQGLVGFFSQGSVVPVITV